MRRHYRVGESWKNFHSIRILPQLITGLIYYTGLSFLAFYLLSITSLFASTASYKHKNFMWSSSLHTKWYNLVYILIPQHYLYNFYKLMWLKWLKSYFWMKKRRSWPSNWTQTATGSQRNSFLTEITTSTSVHTPVYIQHSSVGLPVLWFLSHASNECLSCSLGLLVQFSGWNKSNSAILFAIINFGIFCSAGSCRIWCCWCRFPHCWCRHNRFSQNWSLYSRQVYLSEKWKMNGEMKSPQERPRSFFLYPHQLKKQ